MTRNILPLSLLVAALALFGCVRDLQLTGTVTDTGNPTVTGKVYTKDGWPAPNVGVRLMPQSFDPVSQTSTIIAVGMTDSNGVCLFKSVAIGKYTLEAVDRESGTRAMVREVVVSGTLDTVVAQAETLDVPGKIIVPISGSMKDADGYFFIPGTTTYCAISAAVVASGYALIDSVAAGTVPMIRYATISASSASIPVKAGVAVAPGQNVTVINPGWVYSKKIFFNTTVLGANVSGNVLGFPVLVRLTNSTFDFGQARSDGGDLRFAKQDGTPLSFEIERWDPAALAHAEIWVRVDTVFGNDNAQFITMHWGASTGSASPSLSNGAAVFDTAKGFQGVWHLNEPAVTTVHDATANNYRGTKSGATLPAPATGMVGTGQEFDGSSSFIRMAGTADSKLNFPENGSYSLSAWVYVDTLQDTATQVVASKGCEQYFLKVYALGATGNFLHQWEFTEFHNHAGWQLSSYRPVAAKVWKYMVGTRDGASQRLYLDGVPVATSIVVDNRDTTIARNTGDDFSIGKFLRRADYPRQGFNWFNGTIDEVRVSSVAHSADWIKLCYMNQREDDRLVVFK